MRVSDRSASSAWGQAVCGFLGGAITSLAFPPVGFWYLAPLSGAVLTHASLHAATPRDALRAGLACGVGLYGCTLYWLFAGIQPSHAPVLAYAAPALLILAFAMAPAMVAYFAAHARRAGAGPVVVAGLLVPGLWCVAEWLRHFSAVRFPWAHLGYTQVPDSPLATFASLTGVLGIGYVVVLAGALLTAALSDRSRSARLRILALLSIIAVSLVAGRLTTWTQPVGNPIRVALYQGAFPMSEKFDLDSVIAALEAYGTAVRDSTSTISILPETALPLREDQFPDGYLDTLHAAALHDGRDVLLSFFRNADATPGYYNSAHAIGVSGRQTRDKRVLVPFGEYVPAATWLRPLYERMAAVPLLDTLPGSFEQGGIILGGMRIALKLCFEDAFANLFRDEVAAARFLIVTANDSWTGSNVPMHQHLQIAQTRAAEAGKPLLRVANTGWSAHIAADGRVLAAAPVDQPAMLEVFVQPHEGVTPYIRHGDAIPLGIATLGVLVALLSTLHRSQTGLLAVAR